MKLLYLLVLIVPLVSLAINKSDYNALVIDSAYPPLAVGSFSISSGNCFLVNENNVEVPIKGECFNRKEWSDVQQADVDILTGILDFYAKKKTPLATKWEEIKKAHPKQARTVQGKFVLASHGTRSAFLVHKHSDNKARILPIRVMTSQVGLTKQSKSFKGSSFNAPKYYNGCGMINWSSSQMREFKKGKIQPYQRRIQKIINENTNVKVINISLGYKKSWIQEDNPKCTDKQVEKEFSVLRMTWRSLMSQFPNKLFFAAAGNENQNFNNPTFGDDDLWSKLSDQENLVIVGSTTTEGFKYKSSNYGDRVDIMTKGEDIEAVSPLPLSLKGHLTTLRGTSFSTPQVAGKALTIWTKGKSATQVKKELISHFKDKRSKQIFKQYEESCADINKHGQECLQSILTLFRNDFTWGDFSKNFKKGKSTWEYKPFPIVFTSDIKALAKLKLDKYQGEYIPHLYIKPTSDTSDLLITLNHELYHYSSYVKAAKFFKYNSKINNCITQYRLELLRDEKSAFLNELMFWEKSPKWFKQKLKGIKFESKLLQGHYDYESYYKKFKQELNKNSNFVLKRYIELGEYPKCSINFI